MRLMVGVMKKLYVLLLVIAAPNIAYAVSFDCNKAKTPVEYTICNNAELSSLDDQLATRYKEAIRTTDKKESLKADQRRWLTIRNNCNDIECLKDVYINRIGALDGYTTQVAGERLCRSGEMPVDQRFLGRYTTGNGKTSINIKPSARKGEVQVSIKEGIAKGDLLGAISADGQLCATGEFRHCTILGGCSRWDCNVYGVISDNRLTGKYELVPKSRPGTIIGDKWEKRPSGTREGSFELEKFVPAYTRR